MADQYSLCLLTVMDRLWYHQIILFSSSSSSSSSSSLQVSKTLNSNTPLQLPNSALQQHETPYPLSPQEKLNTHLSEEEEEKERPTRMNKVSTIRTRRSYSSSTVELQRPRNLSRSSSMRALETYSMISSRSLKLEMEEVQGFMDLGFNFNKENISPRLSSIVPGLLRLNNLKFLSSSSSLSSSDFEKSNDEDDDSDIVRDEDEDEGEDEKGVMRPYLSEAWLIKRPDSPLLNLKLPRGNSDDSDMKKHLKFWARTVATVIHQESY